MSLDGSAKRRQQRAVHLVFQLLRDALLMLGFLPEEADLTVWSDFGTLTNGMLEIRESTLQHSRARLTRTPPERKPLWRCPGTRRSARS